MYRLMIVDDEQSIRMGMANSILWEEWGFEIVGLAEDGMQAVEMLSQKPDVVLSDIRMPRMDGISLMQYLNKNHPEIKIIILSGYNDFEYLNMSIKNHVTDYLLKPTDIDEFEQLFRKVKLQLDEERQQEKQMQLLRTTYETHKDEKYVNMMKMLLGDYADYEDEKFRIEIEEFLGFSLLDSRVLVLLPDGMRQESRKRSFLEVRREILTALKEQCEGQSCFFLLAEQEIIGVLGASMGDTVNLRNLVFQMQERIQVNHQLIVAAGISNPCKRYRDFSVAYEQAQCGVFQRMFIGAQSVVFYHEIVEESFFYKEIHFDQELFQKYILSADLEGIHKEAQRVFAAFENKVLLEFRYVDRIILEVLFQSGRWMIHYGASLEEVIRKKGLDYADLYSYRTLDEKQDFLLAVLEGMSDAMSGVQSQNKKNNSLGLMVKDYIDKEYMNNGISLEYLSTKVNKNPAYISKVFKMETGYNFSDYLTQKRVERGKSLLEDSHIKVYKIAEQIGYADVSNFIKVFKKQVGISPNEYKNRLGGSVR